jgi:hypothetical protein
MHQSAEKIFPRDCAFLLALPTGRAEFQADFRGASHDFLRSQYKESSLSAEEAWSVYRPVAEDLLSLLRFLEAKGVRVVPRSTFAQWIALQKSHKVVVLFAHWRNGLIQQENVWWPGIDTFTRENNGRNPLREKVRRIAVECSQNRTSFVASLNRLLIEDQLGDHAWFGREANQVPASPEHRLYMNRKFLEEALPGIFGENSSVEFADGLVRIETIASNASPVFQGIFDLSVCNSILLGELIKTHAPRCLVVATKIPAVVGFQIVFYRALFEFLAPGRPYLSALEELRSRILVDLEKS